MRTPSPTRRTGTALVVITITALSLLSASAVGAFIGDRYGDGTVGKVTKTTVVNAGGVYSAQGGVNHYAVAGKKLGAFTVDVKDKSVSEINYFGSTFCFVPNTKKGETEPVAVTKSFSGTESVAGKAKAKVKVRLPKGHLGCDLSLIATVLRPGDGIEQSEIIVRKMVLSAGAS